MAPVPVYMHVYDIFWTNNYTHSLGLGFYHSGIEVYGHEYGYGGHPFDFSGLIQKIPKDEKELGDKFHYKETVFIGYTNLTEKQVQRMLVNLSREWHGSHYNLVLRNCNHFSNHFCELLSGRKVPAWVNRFADMTRRLPLLDRVLPKQWLKPFSSGITVEDVIGGDVDLNKLHHITFCNRIPENCMLPIRAPIQN